MRRIGKPSAWAILGWALAVLVVYFGVALLAGAIALPLETSPDDPGATAIMVGLAGGLIATAVAFLLLPTIRRSTHADRAAGLAEADHE